MATSKYIEVQRLWSGLGYNNRAKRLFEASKIINDLGFNKLYPNFNKLPGVGEYTKNALLSFAYDEKVLRGWEGGAASAIRAAARRCHRAT